MIFRPRASGLGQSPSAKIIIMRKYLAIFKLGWQNSFEYRADFFGHMMLGLISLLVMYFVWSSIFQGKTNFGNYTFSSMMTYLVLVRFLHFVKRGDVGRLIANEIKEGNLSAYLLKPMGYLRWWWAIFWADRVFELILRILMLFVFIEVFPKIFEFPGFSRFFLVLLFLILSLFLNFIFNVLIASFAFFVTDVRLFRSSLLMTFEFFAGAVIPLDLMPGLLGKVGFLLPFKFWIYFPIKIYQNQISTSQLWQGIILYLVWMIILFCVLRFLWKKGIKNYEAIGQ